MRPRLGARAVREAASGPVLCACAGPKPTPGSCRRGVVGGALQSKSHVKPSGGRSPVSADPERAAGVSTQEAAAAAKRERPGAPGACRARLPTWGGGPTPARAQATAWLGDPDFSLLCNGGVVTRQREASCFRGEVDSQCNLEVWPWRRKLTSSPRFPTHLGALWGYPSSIQGLLRRCSQELAGRRCEVRNSTCH